jgi:hypothetical protein
MVQSREQLKHAFRSGAIPTANDFANLIDSLAHEDEVSPLPKQIEQLSARTSAVEQKTLMPATLLVDADGGWKVLKSGVDSILAYEILAHIEKTKASPFAAVTHAIAVIGATRSRPSVRQTRSFSQWRWPWILAALAVAALVCLVILTRLELSAYIDRALAAPAAATAADRAPAIVAGLALLCLIAIAVGLIVRDRRAITIKWRSSGRWFDPQRKFDLMIRSGCDYGSKTQKVQINCQITRLWA